MTARRSHLGRGPRAHFGRPFDPANAAYTGTLRVVPQAAAGRGVWVHDLRLTDAHGRGQELYHRLREAAGAVALAGVGGAGDPIELTPFVEISDSLGAQTFGIARVFLGTLFITELTGADPIIPRGYADDAGGAQGYYDDFPAVEVFVPAGYLLDVYPSGPDEEIHAFCHVTGINPLVA